MGITVAFSGITAGESENEGNRSPIRLGFSMMRDGLPEGVFRPCKMWGDLTN